LQHPHALFPRLFPKTSRTFYGKRWLNIFLRTMHLIGIAGVGAAFLYQAASEFWLPYMILTLISGAMMVVVEIWSNGIWLIQIRGLATILKLMILSLTFWFGLKASIIILVIIISGIISHAPAKIRYYPFD